MDRRRSVKAEVFRGPFDPGGQPEAAAGQPLELSLLRLERERRTVRDQGGVVRSCPLP